MTPGGPGDLQRDVLAPGRCSRCGMCLSLCPWLDELDEQVAFVSDCPQVHGRCWDVCPQAPTDVEALRTDCLPGLPADPELGPHRAVWLARARDPEVRHRGQYGATVTALALAGLARGDAALLTEWAGDPTRPWLTRPTVARTPEQVAAAAGSKYSSCPSLKLLDPALRDGAGRLLVVGRPCQVTALRKRARLADGAGIREGVTLVVGLFCMWAVSYRALAALATEGGHAAPRRVDVPQGRFVVETAEGSFELDHERVRALARPACARCEDFTAELADVAVGSTEWRDDWNTLIVRSETGEERVTAAEQAGWLELEPFPAEREARLRQAARGKKARVRRRLAEGGE